MASVAAPLTRRRRPSERVIETLLFLAAALGVVTTAGIVLVLALGAFEFFAEISLVEFLTGTRWSPNQVPRHFGVLPLVNGTLLVSAIALVIAIPLGLLAAVYLSEYASARVRTAVKPILETIAGIPTIVLGFFALSFLTPEILKVFFPTITTFNALSAGIVVGLLVTPLIASISEDAMRAVPRGMREAAYAMGATKFEVVRKVVIPAALSGVMASIILAMSRAMGETMAVALAGGAKPQMTIDPRESIQTMTVFIVNISGGETGQGSIEFKSLFAVAALLFLMTLSLNLISARVVRRFRTGYG